MTSVSPRALTAPISAGILCWLALSAGFLGLKMLMQERPQFVGQPMRASKVTMVQPAPQIVMRKVTDSVSAIKPAQPALANVHFNMAGRRDYRGLRTVIDMSGEFRAEYVLTNAFPEPVFVLFKCPHPRGEDGAGLQAAGLKLVASAPGVQESAKDAWLWTGTIEAQGSATIEISYQVASLKAVQYRIGEQNGNLISQHRIAFQRRDLPSMRFESGDGVIPESSEAVAWERKDFLGPDHFAAEITESRNLYASLSQLMEIGPLISLLFLLSVGAVILARQRLTAIQVLTIAAGYGLYFPLILYLSSRFSFAVALVIAVAVPGALLLNYARWLLGAKIGLLGGLLFLSLYQVFPTLAAFAGWNRGMVLLCLGVVTLWVLINLQNQALKRRAAMSLLIAMLISPSGINAAEVQVILPGELAGLLLDTKREAKAALVGKEPASYEIRHEATYFQVEARLPFYVLRPGEPPVPLFGAAVHLQESRIESSEPELARLVTVTNRLGLLAQHPGSGSLRLRYRVPVASHEGKRRVQIPVLLGTSGQVRLESGRSDLEILTGSLWGKSAADKGTVYELGIAGEDQLAIEWRDEGSGLQSKPAEGSKEFYGIGLTHAQNLTVIHSDGSCTHFAEFELPAFQKSEFQMRLPSEARLISASVNGNEIGVPAVENQLCRIRLPDRELQQAAHRLSFRLAYPALKLGFIGLVELRLPEVFQTAGTLEWVIALPNGFDTQVISSGLEIQKASPDLSRFGDYGRVLKSHPQTYLAKNLAPPGVVSLNLRYRQLVPNMIEARQE